MSNRATIAAADAMRAKRAELIAQPLDRLWQTLAQEAVRAADEVRAAEKRESCQHPNRVGNGAISSDGSSWGDWYCPDCLKSESWTCNRPVGTDARS